MHTQLRSTALVLCFAVIAGTALAQPNTVDQSTSTRTSTPWFAIQGSISTSAEYYASDATGDALGFPIWTPRRPSDLYRLVINSTATLFGTVRIPLRLVLNSTETNTITPSTVSPTLAQILENPLNALSISVRPGVEWAELQLGTHLPRYSDLLGSDVQIFGAGVSATPSLLRVGFNTGVVQRAIASDTLIGNSGSYRRNLTMAKLGIGNGNKWFVDINVVAMRDDTMRLANGLPPQIRTIRQEIGETDPVTGETPFREIVTWDRMPAEEGIMTSMAFRAQINEAIALVGEIAGMGRSRDVRAPELDSVPSYIPESFLSVFRPRESSTFDGAATAALLINNPKWGADVRVKYYGPGFVSFSIPFMMSDYLDLTVSPRFTLFSDRVSFSGTVGQRIMNYSSMTDAELTQLLIASNLSVIFSDVFSVSGTFSNFGIRNGVVNDSLRIQNVARSIIVTPSLTFSERTVNHSISVSASMDSFEDFNLISGRLTSNNTFGVFGNYTAAWTTRPLVLFAGANYLRNNLQDFGFTILNFSVGGSYGFFQNKVTPNINIGVGSNTMVSATADLQLIAQAGIRWNITDKLSLTASTSTNNYRYGSSRPGAQFAEYTTQFSLLQNF